MLRCHTGWYPPRPDVGLLAANRPLALTSRRTPSVQRHVSVYQGMSPLVVSWRLTTECRRFWSSNIGMPASITIRQANVPWATSWSV